MVTDSEYDVAVIGGGPGGYVAAIRAAQLGLKACVIERDALGGVCLNWGCIPSKALLKNAEILSYIHRADQFGLRFDNFSADYSVAVERSRQVVDRMTRGVGFLLRKNNVEHIAGTARLTSANSIDVVGADGQSSQVSARNIIVATGARPRSIPPLPVDGQRIITSREAIVAEDVPASIAIVGGGAIGVEFAYVYRMYGSNVTIIELLPRLVPNEDEEISQQLERAFGRDGIELKTGAGVTAAQADASGVTLTIEKDGATETARFDKVLVAIGVQPNTEDLGLEALGVATDRGYITVDDQMATNVPGVYAVGDVTGKLALAHVASAQGVTAVESIAGEETQPLDYSLMPRATYCHPQVASMGLTEAQAREQGYEVKIGRFNVQASGKAVAMGENDGLVKLVIDAKYGELLGGHMCGPEVTELLGELSMTKLLEGTTLELGWAVHAHPTIAEMLHEAALDAEGRVLHM
ncbi:Dihydrolipoyl dehydrogenase [Geodia barretti]|uniref:Dihydrolipoyl dehydrogenase n=2 Tax=Geodia barretti TaxID=519541 RepID=A0AA35T5P9_GEOBA|nr:Dihydrolipoyl dehydrogenase [Geodia barretti]